MQKKKKISIQQIRKSTVKITKRIESYANTYSPPVFIC